MQALLVTSEQTVKLLQVFLKDIDKSEKLLQPAFI